MKIPKSINQIVLDQDSVKEEIAEYTAIYLLHLASDQPKISELLKPVMKNSTELLSKDGEDLYLDLQSEMSFIRGAFNICEESIKRDDIKSFDEFKPTESEKIFKNYLAKLDDQTLIQVYRACKKYRMVAIFAKSRSCALEVREQLIDRETELFQACEKFNVDKDNGGLIGPLYKNQLPQWLRHEIKNMDVKIPSKPIKVDKNFCIVTIVEYSDPSISSEADCKHFINSMASIIKDRLKYCIMNK